MNEPPRFPVPLIIGFALLTLGAVFRVFVTVGSEGDREDALLIAGLAIAAGALLIAVTLMYLSIRSSFEEPLFRAALMIGGAITLYGVIG